MHRFEPGVPGGGPGLPPPLPRDSYLVRSRLLSSVGSRVRGGRRSVSIEAQAGQGKTVFARQLLSHLAARHCWYALGQEDVDVVSLASSLLRRLQRACPTFRAPLLEEMLAQGALGPADHRRLGSLFFEGVDGCFGGGFWLVFDDVHHLEGSAPSQGFVASLAAFAPPGVRFLTISRHPLTPGLKDCPPLRGALRVGNDELAFSRGEVAELYNGVLGRPVTRDTVEHLHRATEGWAMGLQLLAMALPDETAERDRARIAPPGAQERGEILGYFLREVFSRFPAALRRTALKLSLLELMPAELTREIGREDGSEDPLRDLLQRNFFIKPIDDPDQPTYAFHHLFHACLRRQALSELDAAEVRAVRTRAARWCLDRGRPGQALGYFLAAEAFAEAEGALKDVGFELLASNRVMSIVAALDEVPPAVLRNHPWMSYFRGVTFLNTDPPAAMTWLENARTAFAASGDEAGEFSAMVEMLHFHIAVDARFDLASPLLTRAEELFARLDRGLHPNHRSFAAYSLAMGSIFLHCDADKADRFVAIALRVAQEEGLVNHEASAQCAAVFRHLFGGTLTQVAQVVERSAPLLRDPRLSPFWAMALRVAFANYLHISGQFENCAHHSEVLRRVTEGDLVAKSIIGPIMLKWEIDTAVSRGEWRRARGLIEGALTQEHAGGSSHSRSMSLQYLCMVEGFAGRRREAVEAAGEALRLRGEVGGLFFQMHCETQAGAALAAAGSHEEARRLLEGAIARCDRRPQRFQGAAARAHLTVLRLNQGDEPGAVRLAREFMAAMREQRYSHLYGWVPAVMETVLCLAVRHGLEPQWARHLAAERLDLAILDEGTAIPLLTVGTLGGLRLVCGEAVVEEGDLSPSQRTLLALLLTGPRLQRRPEEIQEALWPESEPDKARAKFDTLLSRLRSTLAKAFAPADVRNYLALQKGLLGLRHCRVDAERFEGYARTGLSHAARGEPWQAGNALRSAYGVWTGSFLPQEHHCDPAEERRRELTALFRKVAATWAGILAAEGDHSQVVLVARRALKQDPVDEDLVRVLYDARVRSSDLVGARRVLTDYEAALRRDGFSAAEIEQILDSFWSERRPRS